MSYCSITPQCGALFIGLIADVAAAVALLATDDVPFVGKSNLLPFGVIGAVCGAFLKVGMAPPNVRTDDRKLRQLAIEFCSALFAGVCLMPMAIHYGGFPHDAYIAMGISFLLATVATGIIHSASPAIERMGIRRAAKIASDLLGEEAADAAERIEVRAAVVANQTQKAADLAADNLIVATHDSKILKRKSELNSPDKEKP